MRAYLHLLAAAVLAATLAGCTATGRNFDPDGLSSLNPGRSTLADATHALGAAPDKIYPQPDGSLLALWSYKVTVVTDGLYGRKEALLRFGPDGRLANLVDSTNILLEPWERRDLLGPAPASEPLPDWALPKVEPGESYIYIPGPGESAGSRPQGG